MSDPKVEVLFLSKQDVESIVTYKDVVAAVEEAFRADGNGQMLVPYKEIMRVGPDKANCIFPMPGYLENLNTVGVKWTNFYPKQPDNFPTIWAHLLILSHMHNGMPYAIMDATTITNMRTSGGHAVVAAKYLAKKDSKNLSVLGCGAQGKSAILSFDQNFDLEVIRAYEVSEKARETCKREMEGKLRARLEFVDTPRELTQEVDILLSATTCREPLIQADWIPPGCLVDAMFAFNDIDPAISHVADKWVVGNRDSDKIEILDHKTFGHLLDPKDVYATLGEVVCGKKAARENDEERIVFTHMGMGTLDIAVGKFLADKAKAMGVGQTLRLT